MVIECVAISQHRKSVDKESDTVSVAPNCTRYTRYSCLYSECNRRIASVCKASFFRQTKISVLLLPATPPSAPASSRLMPMRRSSSSAGDPPRSLSLATMRSNGFFLIHLVVCLYKLHLDHFRRAITNHNKGLKHQHLLSGRHTAN